MRRTVLFYWVCGFTLLGIIVMWGVLSYILRLWLFVAAATCDLQMRDTVLMLGVPVDSRTADGETSLMIAARSGCRTHVWEFIRRGADVNATDNRGVTPLYNAAEVGDAMTVKKLLQSGAHPNSASKTWRTTPLMRAAVGGHIQVVRELLAAGADPSMKDSLGRTALDYAKRGAYPEHRIIEQLLQRAVRERSKTGR